MRMLVADSQPDVADLLSRVLTINGHEAIIALDGSQAISRLSKGHWDVAILGSILSGVATSDVISYARRRAGNDLRIIWAQALPDAESRVAAFRAGADCVLALPALVEELLAAVEAPVKSSQPQEIQES
ncbi:hypothetical protein N9D66_00350 [Candidatus Nanopelagicales bacterium]|nr:hypothetical protein [Candidatus Nanopelagicales bacterium]